MEPPSPYTGPKPVPPVLDTTPAPPFGAHIYQPPRTPSEQSSSAASSRKRSRLGPPNKEPRHTPPCSASANGWSNISKAEALLRSEAASPVPFVTTRYRLAGGLDTPGLTAAAASDVDVDLRTQPYANYRRRWTVNESEDARLRPTIATGAKRKSPPNMKPPGQWPQCLWSFVGGVAGKVWEFARTSAFKGFYAGGGKGYEIPSAGQHANAREDEARGYSTGFSAYESFDFNATPIPGQFPVDDIWGSVDSPTERPVKRQHVESGSGWVLVERRDAQSSPRLATRRLPAGTTAPRVATSRPAYRRSVPGRLTSPTVPGSSSLRSPSSLSAPRSPMHSRHDSAPSGGSLRSPGSLPVEVHEYETRRRKEERQADASIRKINAQLKAMIREGREALGTRVEIVDDVDTEMFDEGYSEGFPVWK
ncbi:hypothetical protein IWZ03DRAFT_365363 [Phyllosticta citriasiana]|uniref:Uncharacterized protein n=1 Tax=Phyllosticta citriasiana TaxID=595635 RepID=A0ABR1KY50_9PEZI